jgi:hypothetical protein
VTRDGTGRDPAEFLGDTQADNQQSAEQQEQNGLENELDPPT